MFTGIIESQGIIQQCSIKGDNKTFLIKSQIGSKLKIDQSLSHDGVCLTVEKVKGNTHQVTAVSETLNKTTLSDWQKGYLVNLERSLKLNSRLDGHFVQGHVDAVGICTKKTKKNGSWEFGFQFQETFAGLVIEKGSIAINGISLTVFNVTKNTFDIAIIPYTYEHTNIRNVELGFKVNLEFDMIGKYMSRKLSLK